jgi:hypothetical protein
MSDSSGPIHAECALGGSNRLGSSDILAEDQPVNNSSHFSRIVLMAALVACQPAGSDRPHTVLGSQAQELRAAFNADSGRVRVVMLAAPT